MELLVVEVHHLEIGIGQVLGGFPAASRRDRGAWGVSKICPLKPHFWAINVGNDKKEIMAKIIVYC